MQNTPASERIFISFFGAANAGKSSVVNRVTNQQISIVSDKKGTTTDPVIKSMELLPLGPVVICDTAGIDDKTELGNLRTERTYEILRKTDIAVLVVDAYVGFSDYDEKILDAIKAKKIPYIICYNKSDLKMPELKSQNEIAVSAKNNENIEKLKEMIASFAKTKERPIVSDLFDAGDVVVLVVPIDESAPKGRLILPQQMVLRELLDIHACAVTVQPSELLGVLQHLSKKPKAVICDSQVFGAVKKQVPDDIYLTSFSILMQRYKGTLNIALQSVNTLDKLKDGDKILISEGCTHHRQCNDIGTVKMPNWILEYTGKKIEFEFTQGGQFPKDLSEFALVVHCGGCMLNEKEMEYRQSESASQNVPFTNYGLVIAKINGILDISTKIFKGL